MFTPNSTVYYTSGPAVQEAKFISYCEDTCVLETSMGTLRIRKGRVFTVEEAREKGLLNPQAAQRVREAFAV